MPIMIIYSRWVSVRGYITGIIKISGVCLLSNCSYYVGINMIIFESTVPVAIAGARYIFEAILTIKLPTTIKYIIKYGKTGNWRNDQKVIVEMKSCNKRIYKITQYSCDHTSYKRAVKTYNYFICKRSRFFFNVFMKIFFIFKRAGILFLSRCFHKKILKVKLIISRLKILSSSITILLKKQNRLTDHTYVPLSQIHTSISSIKLFKQWDFCQ